MTKIIREIREGRPLDSARLRYAAGHAAIFLGIGLDVDPKPIYLKGTTGICYKRSRRAWIATGMRW